MSLALFFALYCLEAGLFFIVVPWTRVWTLSHEDLLEYYCTNNQEVEQYKALKDKESGGKK